MTDTEQIKAAERAWKVSTLLMVAVIWMAVIAISVFSPPLVSGSQQEELPVAAFATWLWGGISTAIVLVTMSRLRGRPEASSSWQALTAAVFAIWVLSTVGSLALPVLETGTDPTKLPVWALLSPVGATVLTGLACVVAAMFASSPSPQNGASATP